MLYGEAMSTTHPALEADRSLLKLTAQLTSLQAISSVQQRTEAHNNSSLPMHRGARKAIQQAEKHQGNRI